MTRVEKVIAKYKVLYIGGHPDYPTDPKFLKTHITLNLYENKLEFLGKDWFPGVVIPFDLIQDVFLSKREISGLDVLGLGVLAGTTKVLNNINIQYVDDRGTTLNLIFEMISGGTIWGTVKKCRQLLSYIPVNHARQDTSGKAEPQNDDFDSVLQTIQKLSQLREQGILTEEEFKSKKEELLKNIS